MTLSFLDFVAAYSLLCPLALAVFVCLLYRFLQIIQFKFNVLCHEGIHSVFPW